MATIAACILPLAGPINGTMHLLTSLRDRGHRVRFLGMPDVEDFVRPRGFDCIPVYERWFPRGCLQPWRSGGGGVLATFRARRRFIMESKAHFEFLRGGGDREFLDAIARIAPDLLIVDGSMRPTWALLAHRSGVPSVYLHTTIPPADDGVRPPAFSTLVPGESAEARRAVRATWDTYYRRRRMILRSQALFGLGFDSIAATRRLARAWGYPVERLNDRTMFSVLLDFPQIVLYPRDFEFPGPDDGRTFYVDGAVDHERQERDFPWDRLSPDAPLVYCSLGSLHARVPFLRTLVEVAKGRPDWQLVVVTGEQVAPETLGPLPANCVAVPFAPQVALLGRAAAAVTHSGINTIRECIDAEVPMVMFPLTFDQPGTAARAQYHGLGVMGELRTATAPAVMALVERVLGEPSFHLSLGRMAAAFRRAAEDRLGVQAVEGLLGGTASRA